MKPENAAKIGVFKACTECGRKFITQHYREISCSKECKKQRKMKKIREAASRLRKNLAPVPCIECGTTFTPHHSAHVTCSTDCGLERQRRQSRIAQAELRSLKRNVSTAEEMVRHSFGPMLMAESVEELDYAYECSAQSINSALKKLNTALKSKMLKENYQQTADQYEDAMDELYVALMQAAPAGDSVREGY